MIKALLFAASAAVFATFPHQSQAFSGYVDVLCYKNDTLIFNLRFSGTEDHYIYRTIDHCERRLGGKAKTIGFGW
ncbi:hypothetical protein N476_24455 [Pseudoalteromonas luteoviolacea H33]|uniref:Uncharacterized protein n=2 Tax=Pseudoalteromonas luteoviolacea TaxID=43657 RepID=A0A167BFH0_9GAMM|nr:hypothetical protein N476_24455 [Pseudoalteromonas luteoviolacea H33]KZN79208.1 hypothetical protein N477_06045 [Pseudoalteromonas luteoviolacea H33-S]